MKEIEFKFTRPDLVEKCGLEAPAYQSDGAACVDLRACIPKAVTVYQSRNSEKIPTGIAINLKDTGYVGLLFPRSGLAINEGLSLANGVGVIDSDYQGAIVVGAVSKTGGVQIKPGDRIAQLMIVPIARPKYKLVENFSAPTKRGTKGLGSTGTA